MAVSPSERGQIVVRHWRGRKTWIFVKPKLLAADVMGVGTGSNDNCSCGDPIVSRSELPQWYEWMKHSVGGG
jgi:hypothetical protein